MDIEQMKQNMKNGKLYNGTDDGLVAEQLMYMDILYDFNHSRPNDMEKRNAILKKFLGSMGEGCYVEPPLHANWGKHTHFGRDVYANFGLTLVDDADIFVGDNVMFAPNVVVATAGHPIEPNLRRTGTQFNMSVHIADNVWIGAGAVILPGVHIGENSVIGAGSVVTKDIPANVVAVGNPCTVLRKIGEYDRTYYYKDEKIPEAFQMADE